MHKIKCRAWSEYLNQMVSWEAMKSEDTLGSVLNGDDEKIHVLLFTTHTDENGAEIYNGDIIEFEFTENSCWGEVGTYTGHIRFDKGVFEVVYHRDPIRSYPDGTWTRLNETDDMKSFMKWADEVKVIGNIHENPELLKDWGN